MRTDSSWGNEQRRPSDSVTTPMDGWFSDINHFERVVMAKARTCRSLSEDEINRMVGWSVFADKSWSHNSGSSSKGSLGKHYLRIIGEGGEPSLPSFRLLSAIVNNAFLSGEAVKRAVVTFSQQLPQLQQSSLEIFVLLEQRRELMDYLESIVVPFLRRTDDPALKAIMKKLLSSGVTGGDTQTKMLSAAIQIDQDSGEKTNASFRWLVNLLLDMCQTEAEQSDIIERITSVTKTVIEE